MSEEEKTIEEQTETIIDAIENETEDDVREAFEVNKEDGPLPALGAPLIRALGDPDPADPNMIQKHLDNFLVMLCGETPIDDNVRTSTEYWLKRLAEGLGGSTKKIYYHPLTIESAIGTYTFDMYGLIINNDPTPYTFSTMLAQLKYYTRAIPFYGYLSDGTNRFMVVSAYATGNNVNLVMRNLSNGVRNINVALNDLTPTLFNDAVNAIN